MVRYDSCRQLQIVRNDTDLTKALAIAEVPLRRPEADEVVVRNRYAGVNAIYDFGLISGRIKKPELTFPFCFGFESVGEVVESGQGVSGLKPGQAVASVRFGGAYRDYQVIKAAELTPLPEASVDYLTLIPTGVSALLALERVGEISSDENILISAAAGGFGHIACQIALARGNRVVGVCGKSTKAEKLKALGVHEVINYRKEILSTALAKHFPDGINLALDTVGGECFDAVLANLAPLGRLVTAGFSSDAQSHEPVVRPRIYTDLYWKGASVRAFMNPLYQEFQPEARERLIRMYQAGELDVWVHRPLFEGLSSIASAIECLRSGANTGKVVVRID